MELPKKHVLDKAIVKKFRIFDFHVFDFKNDVFQDDHSESTFEPMTFHIQIFGINEIGATCAITITDYEPFFYVKCLDSWKQYDADDLLRELKKHSKAIKNATICKANDLYGFTAGKQCTFVKLSFRTLGGFHKIKALLYNYSFKGCRLKLYEANLHPILRYFHIQNISPSGWVKFRAMEVEHIVENRTTTCTYEYKMKTASLHPLPNKETMVPFKICSFDIEASSSHGDFPIPIKSYKRLATQFIDLYDKLRKTAGQMLPDLVRNIILCGFGFKKLRNSGIDLVYPKVPVQQKAIETKIDELLSYRITGEQIQTSTQVVKIEEMFTNMKTFLEDNNDINMDDHSDNEEIDLDVNKGEELPKKRPRITAPKQMGVSLFDYLNENTTKSRDERIQTLNTILCELFPPLEGDKVTFIGSTFLKYGELLPYRNHCIVLGTCDPVPNVDIITMETEKEVLLTWSEIIQEENPDIIIGYNIFGFDYEFLFRRAQENECERQFFKLSRRIHDLSAKYDRNTDEYSLENTKIVLATGEYDLHYPMMHGRLQLDMYTYFRRDFILSSYKLDDVAGQFIADDIKRVVIHEEQHSTHFYTKNIMGLHVGDFIHIELCGFTSNYYQDGRKFQVDNISTTEDDEFQVITIHSIEPDLLKEKSLKWTMAKDDVSPQDIFRLTNGTAMDRAKVAKYCIQDCNLVHHLFNKIDVLTSFMEMSRICSVPISYLVFRGQGIKLTSFVAKKCREKTTLMPDLEKGKSKNEGYEGAIVLPPKCDLYMNNPVACVDYSSLYPSSMISQNYSHDSKVWSREYNLDGKLVSEWGIKNKDGVFIYDNLPNYQYIDIEFDTYQYIHTGNRAVKTKVGRKIVRWAQLPNHQKSIMPTILEELLKARTETRRLAKVEKDPFMQNILDKRQLGYKVTANSLYGQCGAKTSTFYEMDVAASTTATGRMMITYAKTMIEEVYGNLEYMTEKHGTVKCNAEYIYGDSVASYTPIIIRVFGIRVDIVTIEQLAEKYGNNHWRSCQELGKQTKDVCELVGIQTWSDIGWTTLHRVIRHTLVKNKNMIRITTEHGCCIDVTDDHSLLLASGQPISPKHVARGTQLLHHRCVLSNLQDKIELQQRAEEYSVDKESQIYFQYCYLVGAQPPPSFADEVVTINTLPHYQGYVYDLTTDNHHFAAGVGDVIVHNTDSVFFTFNLKHPQTNKDIRGKEALEITIEIAQDAAKLCSDFLKPPMELSYEKTLMPFILLSKKRYVGMLYETNPNKGKMKFMGLSLKRRDSCDYLKDVYGGILELLMQSGNHLVSEQREGVSLDAATQYDGGASLRCHIDDFRGNKPIDSALAFLDNCLIQLIRGNVPMDKLMINKALRGYYKNPQQIAHYVLAERIGMRDPGNKPTPGSRMNFVHIVPHGKQTGKLLQGDKIETPEYIVEKGLEIDYSFYITNQLMKPLQQLFGLALEQIWKHKHPALYLKLCQDITRLRNEYEDMETFMKQREKICSKLFKEFFFDKYLREIENKRSGVRPITNFFMTKK